MKTKKEKIIMRSCIIVLVAIVLGIFFTDNLFINSFKHSTGENFFEDTITITDNGYVPKGVTFSDDIESVSKKTKIDIQNLSGGKKSDSLYIEKYNVDCFNKPFEVFYSFFENDEKLDSVQYFVSQYPADDFSKSAKTIYKQAINFLGEPAKSISSDEFIENALKGDMMKPAIMGWKGDDGSAVILVAYVDSLDPENNDKKTIMLQTRIISPEQVIRDTSGYIE